MGGVCLGVGGGKLPPLKRGGYCSCPYIYFLTRHELHGTVLNQSDGFL